MNEKTQTMISVRLSALDLEIIDGNARAAGLNRTQWIIAAAMENGAGNKVRLQRAIKRANKAALSLAEDLDAALVEAEGPPAKKGAKR
jgi:uncharacterized protein (DUF1778 family)